ncbi:E3 ubiquitin-protein ligase RING1-like [Lathyrus oleraceus]|uniref:E3 ubiquitin-protein ligase RING1-like n=1 Tax=Pisum sativum TaxID=3888 RepID=UPI0021CFDB6A|nr:E3 ubiquitin-protein ligase RING1-like [Pisum sativum]
MSYWSEEEICLILALCFLVFVTLRQWKFFKCLLCKAITTISSSNSNWNEGQFQDESIPQNLSPQFEGSELELSIINSLPMYQFTKSEIQESLIDTECAICLGEFEEGEWLKLVPNCNHGFHVSCIDKWFQLHSSCPLCRSRVYRILIANHECSVSVNTWLEILGMDDITPERNALFQSHSL